LSSKSNFSNSTSKSYALALYELSKESSELEKVEEGVKSINQLMKDSLDFKELILNPTVAKEDKKNVLLAIADKNNFSSTLKKFLSFLSAKNRLFFLSKICEAFLNLVSSNKGELKAKIVSAKKLSEAEKNMLQKELSEDFKSLLNINYEYNPDLLAGLTIQIGSTMIDTSIKSKLKKLEKSMIEV
tara:strand:+ start:3584 stop:4141 length:558 start_codon:yes stop_codon:yes gene_type:complete